MNNNIKNKLSLILGKNITIIVDVGRNKYDKYKGKILSLYDNIWLFESNNILMSFSYSDIISNFVIINP